MLTLEIIVEIDYLKFSQISFWIKEENQNEVEFVCVSFTAFIFIFYFYEQFSLGGVCVCLTFSFWSVVDLQYGVSSRYTHNNDSVIYTRSCVNLETKIKSHT